MSDKSATPRWGERAAEDLGSPARLPTLLAGSGNSYSSVDGNAVQDKALEIAAQYRAGYGGLANCRDTKQTGG